MGKIKTTSDDFDFFKKSCQKYIDIFKLDDWHFYFSLADLNDRYAQTLISLAGRSVNVQLCKEWFDKDEKTKQAIDDTAKHEMVHVLLAPIANLAYQRYVSLNDLDSGEHAVVQKLMKLL